MFEQVAGDRKYEPSNVFCSTPGFYVWLGRDATILDLMTAAIQGLNRELVRSIPGGNAAVGFLERGDGGVDIMIGDMRPKSRHDYAHVLIPREQTRRLAMDYNYRRGIAVELRRGLEEIFYSGKVPKGLQINGITIGPGVAREVVDATVQ